VGHFIYQMAFISALGLTTVANSALISGLTPVAITLLAAAMGHERIGRWHWAGLALSIAGLYFVSGHGARLSGESLRGDLFMLAGVACWACYTVFSRPLLERHSPLAVTGLSMALGTALFVPIMVPALLRFEWGQVSAWAWLALGASAILALNVAYLIWYTAVQRIGSAHTSAFSNMVPVTAMLLAWLTLGEQLDSAKIAGAAAIVGGVVLTRVGGRERAGVPANPPPEE
jgi:drug/metabolite transporter (DMT)-like permease